MAIEARPINGSVLAFKTTAPSTAVTLCQIDLATGRVDSAYFSEEQKFAVRENAAPLLAVIDPEDRELASPGIMARLLPVSSLDAGVAAITTIVEGGVAIATVPVAGTRYFAVQVPHSIFGGLGFSPAEGTGDEPVVSADNSFKTTSPETLQPGMLVVKNRSGPGVVRANANDVSRMPAVGMVAEVKDDGTIIVQTSGPVVNRFVATGELVLFAGGDGYPTPNITSNVTYVQTVGVWATTNTLILNLSGQYIQRV